MATAEISRRLQEGWTLLNEQCPMPNCGTPLLRDHNKEVYCAACQMYCISAKKAKALDTLSSRPKVSKEAVPTSASTDRETPIGRGGHPRGGGFDAQQTRAAAEAAMGEKLLLGWTMLAEECPTTGCCFPLMRDRSRNTQCVACGVNGVAAATATVTNAHSSGEGDVNRRFTDTPAAQTPVSAIAMSPLPPAAPTAHSGDVVEESGPVISEEEFAVVRKKRDALSASLGRYMLQGWSLLDRMCPREDCEPGTPLLKNVNTGVIYCAGCDTHMCEGETGGLVAESTSASGATDGLSLKRDSSGERGRNVFPAAEEAAVQPAPAKSDRMQAESAYELNEMARLREQAAREHSGGDTASERLARRLLQGWAMLSTTCPEPGCHNPLMRDRNGQEQCVSCSSRSSSSSSSRCSTGATAGNATVSAIATARQGEGARGRGREGTAAAVSIQAAGDVADQMETVDEDEDQAMLNDRAAQLYVERRRAELLAASAGARAETARDQNPDAACGPTPADRLRVHSQALDGLYRALDLSQQRLRACSSSSSPSVVSSVDVDESMRQADLISKLAVAIRSMLELPDVA